MQYTQDKTILLVDDETHILNVVSIKLQNAGFRVVTAEDGQEAYELACQCPPDLVITDYQMPILSGMELCAKLRSDPRTCDVPAVILTARGFAIPRDEGTPSNVKEVIDKPFSPREVLACVHRLLGLAPVASK